MSIFLQIHINVNIPYKYIHTYTYIIIARFITLLLIHSALISLLRILTNIYSDKIFVTIFSLAIQSIFINFPYFIFLIYKIYFMIDKPINYQAQYSSIKGQYDSLLQKNQNDLIRIKQKQKTLNEQLQKVKKEKHQSDAMHANIIKQLKEQIDKERNKNSKGQLTVSLLDKEQQKIQDLQIDIRSLMDQNITLTSQNTALTEEAKAVQYLNQNLTQQIQQLKQYIHRIEIQSKESKAKSKSMASIDGQSQSQSHIFTEDDMKAIKQQLSKAHKELDRMSSININLQNKIKTYQEETKVLSDRQRKTMTLLKKRESDLLVAQAQNEKLKNQTKIKKRKTQTNDSICIKCKQLEQQIQLLKQMVKSTKGMVRVKEIQVQKYRLHQQVKDNKSVTRPNEKTSFPPLKKKANE